MLICEMTDDECRRTLPQEATVGRLACAQAGQPYVVPVYLVSRDGYLYGFSSVGLKIECMRANPLVCVEIEDVNSAEAWTTVIVFGTYEELPDTRQYETARLLAHSLLRRRPMWWQPASVAVTGAQQAKTFAPIFYRIRINRITGHRAAPDPAPGISPPRDRQGLLKRIVRRVRSRK
jgi:nitroimidazol reductase NimA-like FMN-containing flavoprotein (pyridoxamine 5'-phosphate oxidase superfamily)